MPIQKLNGGVRSCIFMEVDRFCRPTFREATRGARVENRPMAPVPQLTGSSFVWFVICALNLKSAVRINPMLVTPGQSVHRV